MLKRNQTDDVLYKHCINKDWTPETQVHLGPIRNSILYLYATNYDMVLICMEYGLVRLRPQSFYFSWASFCSNILLTCPEVACCLLDLNF